MDARSTTFVTEEQAVYVTSQQVPSELSKGKSEYFYNSDEQMQL
jgi:hypothetical protein